MSRARDFTKIILENAPYKKSVDEEIENIKTGLSTLQEQLKDYDKNPVGEDEEGISDDSFALLQKIAGTCSALRRSSRTIILKLTGKSPLESYSDSDLKYDRQEAAWRRGEDLHPDEEDNIDPDEEEEDYGDDTPLDQQKRIRLRNAAIQRAGLKRRNS